LPAATATGLRLLVVEREQLKLGPVRGLDPEGGLQRIGGSIEIGRADEAKVGDPEAAWSDAVTAGRRALGHQIAGTITAMLDSAIEHARVREQFGQAIGSYQAVRHRLAETRVALEAARDGLTASWDDDTDHAAICAKALSGRSLRDASRHCQQVLAGMGFSAEHVFPSLYKRGVTLDALLGSSMELTVALGDALASGKRLLPLTGLDHPVSEPIGTSLHRSHRSWR
jgi:alkylation response protein AidB-like acyl-CoA dehydrogenase